jgi:hypothetical protein
MTVLDEIIDGATNDAVSTSNLLRKVQVVAHRLGATELTEWVKSELNGYRDISSLPLYRGPLTTPVLGTWAGYGGSSATLPLGQGRIPDNAVEALFRTHLNQSIAELEQLAEAPGENDPAVSWEPMQVVAFNPRVEEGLVPGMQMMNLISAKRVIPKGVIRGAIGSSRNTALDFALELQAASPDAGSQNGPTVQDEPIASTVYTVTNNIYGHGANIAHGSDSVQTSTVSVGDLSGLLLAARQIGLTDTQAEQEFAAVAVAPAEERESKKRAFLEKVQNGLFAIGTNASTTIVVNQLEQLLNQYLGI